MIWMLKLFVNREGANEASKQANRLRLELFQKSPEAEIPYLQLTIHSFCETPSGRVNLVSLVLRIFDRYLYCLLIKEIR